MNNFSKNTPDFTNTDTVRSNPYMKKISNQKYQSVKRAEINSSFTKQDIDDLKNMELNTFKNIYETSITSNQNMDSLLKIHFDSKSNISTNQNQSLHDVNVKSNTIQNQITDKKEIIDPTACIENPNQPLNEIITFADSYPKLETLDSISDVIESAILSNDGSGVIKKINGMRIIEPNFLSLLNATKEKYKQRSDEIKSLDLAFDREYKKGIMFQGGSGVGKTLLCLYYATMRKLPCVFLSCHSGITKDELIGSYQLVDNNSAYVLGELIQAIICANNSPEKKAVLVLDELNCLNSDTMKILNEMLRFKDGIIIPELGIKYRLNPDCKILVLATGNPLSYQGVNELNAELESRFEIIQVPDLSSEELRDLINTDYKIDSEFLDNLIRLKEMIVEANVDSKLDKGFDTREFVKVIDQYSQLTSNGYTHERATIKAITSCLYGKFSISDDDDQTRFVRETIESTLGIQQKELSWF